ncbi:MAG: hypothetical protein KTR32_43770 [Granulosicoccus sp.]|nr:hypothetical protein [Granulosicoccus sp.]
MKNTQSRLPLLLLFLISAAGLTACATPVGEVQKWGISGSEVAEFSGEVVDVLCEVSGNCAEQCGAGTRQLGIKTDQGTILIAKDLNLYTGAAEELWPFCSQQLVVNGQFTESGSTRFFQIQNVRNPDGPWMSTTRFLEAWAEKNGKSVSDAKRWYRQDPRVTTVLERDGLLGLGPDVK